MKTTTSKLLLALTMCFSVAAAHAEGDNSNKYSSKEKTSTKSTNVTSPETCGSVVVATACGPIQKTTCSSTGGSSVYVEAEKSKEAEQHKNDKDHTKDNSGDRKDHTERQHDDNDSLYKGRDKTKDRSDGYRWEQTNSNGVKQDKVTICHRSGGANVTITVDDDGYFHGHSKHVLDSLGKCEDQDDNNGKYKSGNKNSKAIESLSKDAATASAAPACTAAGGVVGVTAGLGCNTAGVTCAPINARPSRGGGRTVR